MTDLDVRWAKAALPLLALLLFGAALVPLNYAVQTPYFSHDDIGYIGGYLGKLQGEGRWINHLIFRFARRLPESLAYVACWGGFLTFLVIVYRKIGLSWSLAICAGALTLHHPAMYDLLTWPLTIAPSCAVLALASICSFRLGYRIVIPLFGIVLMGMYQGLIYLLPLLYISSARSFRSTAEIIFIWGATFVAGYALALVATARITGSFGLTVDEWRQANPVTGWGSFMGNIVSRAEIFARDIHLSFPGVLLLGLLLATALWSVVIFRRKSLMWPLLLACGVVFCHYGITLINGIAIQPRTTFHIFTAIAAFAVMAAHLGGGAGRVALLVSVLPASVLLWSYSVQNVRWFQEVTSITYDDIQAAVNVDGQNVVMDFRSADAYWASVISRISGPPVDGYFETRYQTNRVLPALKNLGAASSLACPARNNATMSEECSELVGPPPLEDCEQPVCADRSNEVTVLRFGGRAASVTRQ